MPSRLKVERRQAPVARDGEPKKISRKEGERSIGGFKGEGKQGFARVDRRKRVST